MTIAREKLATLYDRDYVLWIEATLARLRNRDYDNVDWDNLLDEIEGMARSDRRALKNNLRVILLHLLKWEFQPEMRSGSCSGSIDEHRTRVWDLLEDSPSLQNSVPGLIAENYPKARRLAAMESALPLKVFPVACPYDVEAVLDEEFWPGEAWD